MTERDSLTRRQFLASTVAGGMAGAILRAGRTAANFPEAITQVAFIGGVPTFVRGGNLILRPSFETYAPAPHYFETAYRRPPRARRNACSPAKKVA